MPDWDDELLVSERDDISSVSSSDSDSDSDSRSLVLWLRSSNTPRPRFCSVLSKERYEVNNLTNHLNDMGVIFIDVLNIKTLRIHLSFLQEDFIRCFELR